MKRTIKNIIMVLIIIISLLSFYKVMKLANTKIEKVPLKLADAVDEEEPPEKPNGRELTKMDGSDTDEPEKPNGTDEPLENGGKDQPEKPNGTDEPPAEGEKPIESNPENETTIENTDEVEKEDSLINSTDSEIEASLNTEVVPKINYETRKLTTKFYLIFVGLSLILAIDITYLIISKFNKLTLKECLVRKKIIIGVSSILVLVMIFSASSSYITVNYILNSTKELTALVED